MKEGHGYALCLQQRKAMARGNDGDGDADGAASGDVQPRVQMLPFCEL